MENLKLLLKAKRRNEKPFGAAIIVTSDTCYADESKDNSGTYVQKILSSREELFSNVSKHYVRDDAQAIVQCLKGRLKEEDPALIITIGGTGLCPRDVTPDALSPLYERHCNGIVAALQMTSLRYSPNAALSRLTAGIIGECLIVNFPGSLRACGDCMACLNIFIEHALEQIRFNAEAYKNTHAKIQTQVDRVIEEKTTSPSSSSVVTSPNRHVRGEFVSPSVHSQTSDKKHLDSNCVCPERRENLNSTSSIKLAQRASRLSIQEVQNSRAELQPIDRTQTNNSPLRLKKKYFSYKRKFTSLDNLNHKQPQKMFERTFVKLPSIEIPATGMTYPMIDYVDAQGILSSQADRLLCDYEEIVLNTFDTAFRLNGRVLAADIKSMRIVPPYSVSTMDGYVLNLPPPLRKAAESIKKPPPAKLLKDLDEFKSYQVHPQKAQTFFCYRVNTGGRLPDKNFAVVTIERTSEITDQGCVQIYEAKQGIYQRKAGSDIDQRDTLGKGTMIGPIEMSLLISMGLKKVPVFKQPRIGVLSTGDELVNFFSTDEVGQDQVADANGPLLSSMFRLRGFYSYNCGIVRDEPKDIFVAMTEALKRCEILVVTGGASMGTKDYVKDVIKHMSGLIHFGRVNIKPGKPAAFASLDIDGRRKFIFSLPGNPVSAYITTLLLVLPFIELGTKYHFQRDRTLSLDCVGELVKVVVAEIRDGEPYEFEGRLEFVRAKIISTGPKYMVSVSMKQQSSRILSLRDFNCLIMIEPSLKGKKFEVGNLYDALRMNRPEMLL